MRRVAAALATAIAAAATACTAPQPSAPAHTSWAGVAYPQRVATPSLRFEATDGSVLNLAERSRGRTAVLVYASLSDPSSQRFLIALARAARSTQATHPMIVIVTTDPRHDSLAAMRSRLAEFDANFIGVRAPFPRVEASARATGIDVTEPKDGRYVTVGPQVVGFGTQGTAKVAWRLDVDAAGLAKDLERLAE